MTNQQQLIESYWKSLIHYIQENLTIGKLRQLATHYLELPRAQQSELGTTLADMKRLRLDADFREQVARDVRDFLQLDRQQTDYKITPLLVKSTYLDGVANILDSTNPQFSVIFIMIMIKI